MTECLAKYSSFVFWDLVDTFRLCFIPSALRKYMREIDISFVLGCVVRYAELLDLVYVVDGIDCIDVPVSQARRGRGFKMSHPVVVPLVANFCGMTRTSSASSMGTLICLDPWHGV